MDRDAQGQTEEGAPRLELPEDFGDYELLSEIGHGGQAVVFRAWQKSLNRQVALKIIGIGQWASDEHLKRLRREARAAAKLNHSGIVPIYEVGERKGVCYISMRFVEGGSLEEAVARAPFSVQQAAELIAKVARIVHYAHERGILHRDIKPGNILLDASGNPHLSDFGLARLVEPGNTVTRTRDVMGTPSYMAPEQAAGNKAAVGCATDVYGLGAVLYELLTGHPPFSGETTYETIRLLLDTEPRQPRLWNPKIDRDLATICLKCLEKDPRRRYPTALALAEDLERWARREPIYAKRSGAMTRFGKWVRRNPAIASLVFLSFVLAVGLGLTLWQSQSAGNLPLGIAVLPFENLSDDQKDAFFADGVQDDILTKLAKIADLRVISRTSVMAYRGRQNMREIGRALRVSHAVEGSARRHGRRIHLNVQLIDTRSDTPVWSEEYDRDLSDLFAVQTQIAQTVAEKLHAKLSADERLAIERQPTADLAAFDLYAQARDLLTTPLFSGTGGGNIAKAADLLHQAVARDPSFFDAYCQLAYAHDLLYFLGEDHTPARLAMADAAVEAAARLRSDAGETHLARAENLYRGHLDYHGALAELELAARTLPNEPSVFELKGYIQRRQGEWEEAMRNLERATDLDPRNVFTLEQIALSYQLLRRYADTGRVLDRILTLEPDNLEVKAARAFLELDWKGDIRPLHQFIEELKKNRPDTLQTVANYWLFCALAERNADAAKEALAVSGQNPIILANENIVFDQPFIEGFVARLTGDEPKARSAFAIARSQQEKIVEAEPTLPSALCVLALIDAALGRKDDALREGRRAAELLPLGKDAVGGAEILKYSVITAAWVGDNDLACQQLALLASRPSPISYGQLKLLPFWDPLRGDPRFEALVTSLAPTAK